MKAAEPARLPTWRVVLIFVIAIALMGLVIYELGQPLRQMFAERFLSRGDTYLASLQFDDAEREYNKALSYDGTLTTAKDHLALAKAAPTDIAVARDFYAQKGVTQVVQRIDQAQQPYVAPKEALAAGVALYQQGQFAYAQYPLQRAVQLDAEYPEAWHYLALTYDELAKINAHYRDKAAEARQKRDLLTPRYLNQ